MPLKQVIGQAAINNGTTSGFEVVVCTALSMSVYTKMPCSNLLHKVSYLRLEAVFFKLHAKLAPGWTLIRVNFDPIWEIELKVGGGRSFVSGFAFARLR